ncbi:MAG: hypothetical protein A4E53_02367 [Pelotomaculum sp. PtaB.Bin104]|nr:MAG: hypothetical protein A4E53_02367 [Pelotomaculum sp. PtaB.Bin104]
MPGGRPTKPLALVQGHRTKAEKTVREKAERELLTGSPLKEWPEVKADPIAHKEFARIKKLLKSIKKDDDLFGANINMQCKLHGECKRYEELKESCNVELKELYEAYQTQEIEFLVYLDNKEKIHNRFLAYDKKIMDKRKMLLSITKDNIQTIQAAINSIPKKEQSKQKSPMEAFLERRQAKNSAT